MIIQYGWIITNSIGVYKLDFPLSYSTTPRIFSQYISGDNEIKLLTHSIIRKILTNSFELYSSENSNNVWYSWLTIGY